MIEIDPDYEFGAHYVAPGTPYVDEPTATVPSGWYVIGRNLDLTPEEDLQTVIHVSEAYDSAGDNVEQQIAEAIAEALNEKFGDLS